jgi:hypothetical protein
MMRRHRRRERFSAKSFSLGDLTECLENSRHLLKVNSISKFSKLARRQPPRECKVEFLGRK